MPLPGGIGEAAAHIGQGATMRGRALTLANDLRATAEQVAKDRHVSIATIRTQIRSNLEKTGARSVCDLERYIAAA